jgi:hypothetical protein
MLASLKIHSGPETINETDVSFNFILISSKSRKKFSPSLAVSFLSIENRSLLQRRRRPAPTIIGSLQFGYLKGTLHCTKKAARRTAISGLKDTTRAARAKCAKKLHEFGLQSNEFLMRIL